MLDRREEIVFVWGVGPWMTVSKFLFFIVRIPTCPALALQACLTFSLP